MFIGWPVLSGRLQEFERTDLVRTAIGPIVEHVQSGLGTAQLHAGEFVDQLVGDHKTA